MANKDKVGKTAYIFTRFPGGPLRTRLLLTSHGINEDVHAWVTIPPGARLHFRSQEGTSAAFNTIQARPDNFPEEVTKSCSDYRLSKFTGAHADQQAGVQETYKEIDAAVDHPGYDFDVMTIRYRSEFAGLRALTHQACVKQRLPDPLLSDIIGAVYALGYRDIYCLFCRVIAPQYIPTPFTGLHP